MAPRLLALIAAVGMVVGSLALRARLDEDEASSGGAGGRPRLVCSTELEAACGALGGDAEVTVQPAGVTLDRLVAVEGGDPGLDGWLVAGPWPQMVDELRRVAARPPLFGNVPPPLARSPLVIAIWPERAAALRDGVCSAGLDWRCLGDAAGRRWAEVGGEERWGTVRPGHGDARGGAVGLAVVGAATVSFFDRADLDLLDLEDEKFRSWFTKLEQATDHPAQVSPLRTMLVTQRAQFDTAATIEADAAPTLVPVPPANAPQLIYPDPVATADVILGAPGGTGGDRALKLAGPLRDALHGAGWRVDGRPPPEGADPAVELPSASGLPPPGVLLALREVYQEVVG